MAYKAERRLCDTYYHNEKRNWWFETYVTVHKERHHIFKILEDNGYKVIDDRYKVRYLNDLIINTKLYTVKAAILYSDYYCGDFYGCDTLHKEFVNNSYGQLKFKVSAVESNGGNGVA